MTDDAIPAPMLPQAASQPSPAAGWYPEADNPGMLRYWSGAKWEDQRTPAIAPPVLRPRQNVAAVSGLVLGIITVCFAITIVGYLVAIPVGILGTIVSIVAMADVKRWGRRGMASWGLVLNAGPLLIVVLGLIIGGIGGSTS